MSLVALGTATSLAAFWCASRHAFQSCMHSFPCFWHGQHTSLPEAFLGESRDCPLPLPPFPGAQFWVGGVCDFPPFPLLDPLSDHDLRGSTSAGIMDVESTAITLDFCWDVPNPNDVLVHSTSSSTRRREEMNLKISGPLMVFPWRLHLTSQPSTSPPWRSNTLA